MPTVEERQAYKNLKNYDSQIYDIKHWKEIKELLDSEVCIPKVNFKELSINKQEIDSYLNYGQMLNSHHSDSQPGLFIERNSYEASFSKKVYFNSDLEFIVNLFISHNRIHAFQDGNKRTALNIFIDFINIFTNFNIKKIILIQDAQILFLEKEISEESFKKIIYNEVEKDLIKTNTKCNLEHLIPRSDIDDSQDDNIVQSDRRTNFNLTELEKGQFFYEQLRKPFFQRDTNQWTIERVEKLILTFLDDGLIPAVILWEDQEGSIYIIDGAHRISSLVAWVNSDYGKNREFNSSNHNSIESYMDEKVGRYSDIKASKDKYKKEKQMIAKRSISVQWVTGDYDKAKESFRRINEQGVVISKDEKELIQNDKLPISQLSRAVLSHGLGQASKKQNEKTEKIYNYFFLPYLSRQLNNYPLAGSINEDFLISKIYNAIKIIDDGNCLDFNDLADKTIDILHLIIEDFNICMKIYFYGASEKFKMNSFYGFIRLILELKKDTKLLNVFIKNRKQFEEYLVNNEKHIQTIARKKRQATKAYETVSLYYIEVLLACDRGNVDNLKEEFNYLNFEKSIRLSKRENNIGLKYTEFINETPRCLKCGSFIDGDKNAKKIPNSCK